MAPIQFAGKKWPTSKASERQQSVKLAKNKKDDDDDDDDDTAIEGFSSSRHRHRPLRTYVGARKSANSVQEARTTATCTADGGG